MLESGKRALSKCLSVSVCVCVKGGGGGGWGWGAVRAWVLVGVLLGVGGGRLPVS